MKIALSIIILGFVLLSNKCQKTEDPRSGLDNIYGIVWLHSYEEDSGTVKTYRPETYNFPPSRGRQGFKINKDSSFVLYSIAPTDGLDSAVGKWKTGGNVLKIKFDSEKINTHNVELVTVKPEKMQVTITYDKNK
jgi:hypothetical protein